jgi:ABC-2 type transport system permease protein
MKIGKGFKKSFSNRKFKMGGFQTLIMVIVIAVVIVLNFIVGKMNLSVDLSSDGVYTLTDDTKEMAKNISDDITIYYMCQDGNEKLQASSTSKTIDLEKIVNQYGEFSHITVEKKDPVLYPNFASAYTDEDISNNDVIIVNNTTGNSKYISIEDMVEYEVDYTSYSYVPTALDMEGKISSAIQNLTSGSTKKVYLTSGHGEQDLGTSFTDILEKCNYESDTLATSSADKIPEDCDLLMVYGSTYDFTEDETKIISDYLADGGDALFFLNAVAEDQPNYKKLLSDYGVNAVSGYVVDTEQCYSSSYPILLDATVESHDVTADADSLKVYIADAVGLTTQTDVRSTLTTESVLSTSESAFSRSDYNDTDYSNTNDTDVKGPFSTAVAVTDEASGTDEEATHILVYSSYSFAEDDFISTNQFGNRSMVTNSMSWLTGSSDVSNLAIASRSLSEETVSLDASSKIFWTVFLVVVLPLALLVAGFVIWFRRRRR